MKNTNTDNSLVSFNFRRARILLAAVSCSALVTAGTAADVAANWNTHCASCHGKDGKAQTKAGRMAGALDLTDAKSQAKFTDEKGFKSVKEGQTEGGKEKMKPFKDKLNDDEIKALISVVRSLKK